MRVDDFDFDLPESLIAHYPLPERSASRLLALDRSSGQIGHHYFSDLQTMLEPGDLLVFNDTRVIPARLCGQKVTGGKVEILVERLTGEQEALVHLRASKSPKAGGVIVIASKDKVDKESVSKEVADDHIAVAELEVTGRTPEGLFFIRVRSGLPLAELIENHGHMPLPPYIERADEALDRERYQTIYNRSPGAVAAPTAGLHFDQALLDNISAAGVDMAFVTLHVGAGTFQPVRVGVVSEHRMHKEYLEVSEACCQQIRAAKAKGRRVIAVGTTSVRALETAAAQGLDGIAPFHGDTQIFIYPGFNFNVVDAMITNFHLPKSTLLMLVSAFAGRNNVLQAYHAAIEAKYRFFSYGDAMFLHGASCHDS